MLIVVGVVQGRPRHRLGDDACVRLGYAVAALVNYDDPSRAPGRGWVRGVPALVRAAGERTRPPNQAASGPRKRGVISELLCVFYAPDG